MAVGKMMHDLTYGPPLLAVRGVELQWRESGDCCSQVTRSSGNFTNPLLSFALIRIYLEPERTYRIPWIIHLFLGLLQVGLVCRPRDTGGPRRSVRGLAPKLEVLLIEHPVVERRLRYLEQE
jgi:hypothetical protein